MAKCSLLLLSMVLLACSIGRSVDDAMIDGDVVATETMLAGGVLRSYNGCSYNRKPHDLNSVFCCDKDHQCWGSLQECMPNCPCKRNCAKKGGSMVPDSPVQG